MAPPDRRQIGHYVLLAEIGRGGMGVVYRAHDTRLDREVALKVIAPAVAADEAFRKRFHEESRLAARVEHSNVVPIYEASEHDDVAFLAMRYIRGTNLATELHREERFSVARACALVRQIADGLDAVHAAGLVHRDVKPANVLLDESGHAWLTDFGLARQMAGSTALTHSNSVIGTLDYMSPEQF